MIEKLKAIRDREGWTNSRMAQEIGGSSAEWSLAWRYKITPGLAFWKKVCKRFPEIFSCPLLQIMGG